jgi:starch phosphorylase
VHIEHVEAAGIGDTPEVGSTLSISVWAALGELTPGDVQVQVVHGAVRGDDALERMQTAVLGHVETYEGGRHRFAGEVKLETTGSFGYTARVLPSHPLLTSPAELGLIAVPESPAGVDGPR